MTFSPLCLWWSRLSGWVLSWITSSAVYLSTMPKVVSCWVPSASASLSCATLLWLWRCLAVWRSAWCRRCRSLPKTASSATCLTHWRVYSSCWTVIHWSYCIMVTMITTELLNKIRRDIQNTNIHTYMTGSLTWIQFNLILLVREIGTSCKYQK